ncbi:hypothetical protein LBMAG31_04690 [Nitrosomonadaceae bacterium]|nr:hypothetical protein LBMAG31_04690 [Nitrosomonadaceae bacterium]
MLWPRSSASLSGAPAEAAIPMGTYENSEDKNNNTRNAGLMPETLPKREETL